jgi:hypothetical protein
MLEVIAGVVVALAALLVVLEPLLRQEVAHSPVRDVDDVEFIVLEESDSPKIRALLALREIEFDKATGKLSDEDYGALKAKYSTAAVAAIRAEDVGSIPGAGTEGVADDVAEAAVLRARRRGASTCPGCGPRPEPGAVFCSTCGRSLANPDALPRCWICGAPVSAKAKYCPNCGKGLAA